MFDLRPPFRRLLAMGLLGCMLAQGSPAPLVTPAHAQPHEGRPAPQQTAGFSQALRRQLDKKVDDLRTRMKVPGVMVRLVVPGVGTYWKVSGVSDRATRAPLDRNQHFRIGSLTKTFTVTAILQLADEGLLSLDDPVSKYFPDSPRPTATLLDLANMSSGLASYTYDPGFQKLLFGQPRRKWTPPELIAIAARDTRAGCKPDTRACFEPGTRFYYSDTNTVMLGMVIEKVTGKPYAAVLREKILAPLKLTQTSVDESGTLAAPFLHGYTPQGLDRGTQESTTWPSTYAFAVGDMVSTFHDLEAWLPALGKGTQLKPETQALRLRPNRFSVGPTRAYAVGLAIESGWLGHTGAIPGYNVFPYYEPKSGATIIVVVNQDVATLEGHAVEPAGLIAKAVIGLAAHEADIPLIK